MTANTLSVDGHDAHFEVHTWSTVSENGLYDVQYPTGRASYWCSCGARGVGKTQDMAAEVKGHLGIDES